MSNYITEAFKQLNLLEDANDVMLDASGIEELRSFLDDAAVDPDEEMPMDIFDLEAEAQEDLKKSYEGKVILECSVCHSHVFEDKDNISMDEEGLACPELECPYCMSNEGYYILGEVAPFDQEKADEFAAEAEAEDLPDVNVEDAADDIEEDELIEDSLEESMKLDGVEELYDNDEIRGVEELEGSDKMEGSDAIRGDKHKAPINESMDSDELLELFLKYHEDADNYRNNSYRFEKMYEILSKYGDQTENVDEIFLRAPHSEQVEMVNLIAPAPSEDIYESRKSKRMSKKLKEDLNDVYTFEAELLLSDEHPEEIEECKKSLAKFNLKLVDLRPTERGWNSIGLIEGKKADIIAWMKSDGEWTEDELREVDPNLFESVKRRKNKKLKEDIEDVSVTTSDETMTMTTKDDGGVVIETVPKEADMGFDADDDFEEPSGEEMIVPIDDESSDIIDASIDALDDEDEEEFDTLKDETEEAPEEEFEDIEEFDEESFDNLGESYLRNCYENVKSFKTSKVSSKGNKLFIEGIIGFDSGNSKKTNFIFEAIKTSNGNYRLEGYNKQISRGKKTFKLSGSVNNKKFISETLNYNYRSRNELNESVRVYGTIKRKNLNEGAYTDKEGWEKIDSPNHFRYSKQYNVNGHQYTATLTANKKSFSPKEDIILYHVKDEHGDVVFSGSDTNEKMARKACEKFINSLYQKN